jgi:hypothetical protein
MKSSRDAGRKYKSGSQKRREKNEREKTVQNIPKITSWFTGPPAASEPSKEVEDVVTTGSDELQEQHDEQQSDSDSSRAPSDQDHHDREITSNDFSTDLGLWPSKATENMREYWLKKGSSECRNQDSDFKNSDVKEKTRIRHCTSSLFNRRHTLSGETIDLKWLCYSESAGKVFCFVCKLMSDSSDINSTFTTGFNNWKHARESIEAHHGSDQHRKALIDMTVRKSKHSRVDKSLIEQIEKEQVYWRQVLNRCVDVISFLCERGLPLRGKDDKIGSTKNGNFLGFVELLSKYDSFMEGHLAKYGNRG